MDQKAMSEFFEVKEVDEFRTTKYCNQSHQELYDLERKQIKKNGIMADEVSVVRGLKWCRSTNCVQNRIKSRDINAAMNILLCYMSLPARPDFLKRP